jgi:hypothetical protein
MDAWLKYAEWRDWCWDGGDYDYKDFDADKPIQVIEISKGQPFGGETLYKVSQNDVIAYVPIRFISLEWWGDVDYKP